MAVNIGPKIGVDGEAEYRKEINQIIQQAKTLSSEMKAVTAGFDSSTSAQKKAKETAAVLAKQVENQRDRVSKLTEMLNKSAKEFGENDTRTLKWKQAVNEATAELSKMEGELKDAQTQSSKFRTAIEKVKTATQDAAKSGIENLGSKLKSGFTAALKAPISAIGSLVKGVGSLTAAAAAGVVALGKIGVEYNTEMESYTTNFETMLGSSEAAAEKVNSLKELAAKTPFEMGDLADATQQLLAMNVASEDTNKYLQQLGDISLGDSEKLGSLVNAFGKMSSTGKVTLEYINMMAEQGFNPLNVIAQQTGETMEEVYARVSAGKVSFDEIKGAMEIATSAGGQFAGGMEKASQTTSGLISTLKDNATALVGEVFTPISEGLAQKVLPGAISAIDQLTTAFKKNGIKGMITAAGDIIGETLGQFTSALPEFVGSAVSIVESLLKGITDNLDSIADGAVAAVETLLNGILDMLPELIVTGVLLIGKLAAGLIQALPDLIAKIPIIISEVVQGFKDEAAEFSNIGKNIVDGVLRGLKQAWKNVTSWFSNAWNNLIGSSKKQLDINSPSGVFEDIGGYSALGVGVGWTDKFKRVRKDILASLDFSTDYVTPARATVGVGGQMASSRTTNYGGQTFNIYQQPGQTGEDLAYEIMAIIQQEVEAKEAGLGA